MNRNTESYFSQVPKTDIPRSRFDRSHSFKFTGNAGDLIPFLCEEVLPGDTFNIKTSKVIRLQTLKSPVMDNLYMDVYYFFVPNRLVWSHWKEFCGENTQNAWAPSVTYTIPLLKTPIPSSISYVKKGYILDYLGVPPSYGLKDGNKSGMYLDGINALPVRCYNLIWNEWFRDQNYMDPVNLYTGDASVDISDDPITGGYCRKVSRFHDYFSSVLPQPQKGDAPLVGGFSVPNGWVGTSSLDMPNPGNDPMRIRTVNDGIIGANTYNLQTKQASETAFDDSIRRNVYFRGDSQDSGIKPINLVAPGFNYPGFDINTLRLAFQTQKFLERQALGGSRYREIILSHFGVHSPDARQQVPEYLGGNRIPIQIQQIVNTAASENESLGNLGAMSNTTDIHSDFIKSFSEHGYVIGVCCMRYDNSYAQGMDRHWLRKNMYDFYWPVFAHIGSQPVKYKEIWCNTSDSYVWGYQEAWAEYRYKPNRVAGEMRPQVENGLVSWTFADYYSSEEPPVMSEEWLYMDKSNLDRVLAVSSEVSDQFFADFYIKNEVTRCIPMFSIPGLADHF